MINGWTARIQMVGAIVIMISSLLSGVYLSAHDKPMPDFLIGAIALTGGFLYGTVNKFPASGDPVRDVVKRSKEDDPQ